MADEHNTKKQEDDAVAGRGQRLWVGKSKNILTTFKKIIST